MQPEDLEKLRRHLISAFGEARGTDVLERICVQHKLAAMDQADEDWLRSGGLPWPIKDRQKHHKGTARLAHQLLEALEKEAPHGPMSSLTSKNKYELSWEPLKQWLIMLVPIAEEEAACHTERRGPKSTVWRGDLIWRVSQIYGDAAKKTDGGHFEKTIEILLESLESKITDVHQVVIAALRNG